MKNGLFMDKKGDTAEILLYDQIGLDPWSGGGITAKGFVAELKALGAVKSITLKINSPGGDVFEGETIYNELRDHSAKVTVRVMSIAASIASLIAMAGDTIEMQDNAKLMIHKAWTASIGNADEMKKVAGVLDVIDESLVTAYVKRSGQKAEDVRKWMTAETWMTAQESIDRGFADSIVSGTERPSAKFRLMSAYRNAPAEERSVEQDRAIIEQMRLRLELAKAVS